MEKVPDSIKSLPEKAQKIWIGAFNSAQEQDKEDEEKSNKIAWAAVKNKYEQNKDGKWRAKMDRTLNDTERMVREVFYQRFKKISQPQEVSSDLYVREIYSDYIIIENEGKYYSLNYSIKDNNVTLSDNMIEVEHNWKSVRSKQDDNDKEIDTSFPVFMRLDELKDIEGRSWEVIVCQPGLTIDKKWNLPEEVLRSKQTQELFEDIDVNLYSLPDGYATHVPDNLVDIKNYLVKNKVGTLNKVRFVAGKGLQGVVNFFDSAKHLGRNMLEAKDKGRNIYGLSYDFPVRAKESIVDGNKVLDLIKFAAKGTLDIVTRPRAGGQFERAIAALDQKENNEMNKQEMYDLIKNYKPVLLSDKKLEDIKDEEFTELMRLAIQPSETKTEEKNKQEELVQTKTDMKNDNLDTVSKTDFDKLRCEMQLEKTISKSDLPEFAKNRIVNTFKENIFKLEDLERAIADEKDHIAEVQKYVTSSTNPKTEDVIPFVSKNISVGLNSLERASMGLDKLFGLSQEDVKTLSQHTTSDGKSFFLDADKRSKMDCEKYDEIPGFTSIREAYQFFTGDYEVSGRFNRDVMTRSSMAITSSTFSYALGNTLARTLVKDYKAVDFKEQLLISTKKSVKDFRSQEAVLIGYFSNLDLVDPEAADYQEISAVTDEEATYTIVAYGNILTVSRKTIINDDVGVIKKLVSRFARAARRTHADYVWNKMISNTTCADGTAMFTTGHSNLGSSALTHATGLVGYKALGNMTEKDSGEKIGLLDNLDVKPNIFGAMDIFETMDKIEKEEFYYTSNDVSTKIPNPLYNRVTSHVCSRLSDANDWYMILPPEVIDIIEMGYLNGRTEPELFLADSPQSEQVFVADKIRYKHRFEFAGTNVDPRGAYKAVVA